MLLAFPARPGGSFPVVRAAAAISLGILVMVATYLVADNLTREREATRADLRMEFYRSTLVSALEQYQHLPFILARDPQISGALAGGDVQAVNLRLEAFADEAGVDAIYLMDRSGLTIAASNWADTQTFLGQNYGFRPYFLDAIGGGEGEFFAIGATTSRPGYFVSGPVRGAEGDIGGVIAIKIGLQPLTQSWRNAGERVFVANSQGVIVLASDPGWLYRTLTDLGPDERREIETRRQFGSEPLTRLPWETLPDGRVRLDGATFLRRTVPVEQLGWQMHYLADTRRATEQIRTVMLVVGILFSLGVATLLYLRARRVRTALKQSQEDRRQLRGLNSELEREIEVRRQAEKDLEAAQRTLEQTSKLAALGQLSASVTHELGQPISAMQNYIASARMSDRQDMEAFTTRMEKIARRMDNVTRQLRFFARPGTEAMDVFDLRSSVQGAVELVQPDLSRAGIALKTDLPPDPVRVRGQRLRLEQVLVNLLRNAIDAVLGQPDPSIGVSMAQAASTARLCIQDNGPGVSGDVRDRLFEPFATTKASGQGMGLGLAISAAIVKEHGGEIACRDGGASGAVFEVILPVADGGDGAD